jgi:hypothetical protein
MDIDAPFATREGEEEMLSYVCEPGEFRHPAEGAEDEDSEIGGPTPSGFGNNSKRGQRVQVHLKNS